MEQLGVSLIQLLKTENWVLIILGLLIFCLVYFRKSLFVWLNSRRRYFNANSRKLLNHTFFSVMRKFISLSIPQLEIRNKNTEEVIKKFLEIKLTTFLEGVEQFVIESIQKIEKGEHIKLSEVEGLFTDLIKKYNDKALKAGISQTFIDNFEKLHKKNIETTFESIADIFEGGLYYDEFEKLYAHLDILTFAFRATIKDINSIIKLKI